MSEDQSNSSSPHHSESNSDDYSDEELGGLELFSSEDFNPEDYDDDELLIIYHHTIVDLFEQLKDSKEVYDEKIRNFQEMLRRSSQNEAKLKQACAQAQEVINELKEAYKNNEKSFAEIADAYKSEQISHNKTIQELNDLKNSTSGLSANMTVCAAVEIVIKNGKVVGLNMKENMDAVRDDAMMQVNLLTKKVDELSRELNNSKVEISTKSGEMEKVKKAEQELSRTIDSMKTEMESLQGELKEKDAQIEELKKKLEESQHKPSQMNRDERVKALIERRKRLGNHGPRRKSPREGLLLQQSTEVNNSLVTPTLLSDKPTSESSIEIMKDRKRNVSNSSLLASRLSPRKVSASKSFSGKSFPLKSTADLQHPFGELIKSIDSITFIGMNEDGIIITTSKEEGEVELLKHSTFVKEFNLDILAIQACQTKFGLCLTNGKTVIILGKVIQTHQFDEGVISIGESDKGILVVDEDKNVIEIIDEKNMNKICQITDDIAGNIYSNGEVFVYKNTENKIVIHMKLLNQPCYSDNLVHDLVMVGDLIYSVDLENRNKVYIYDINLTLKSSKLVTSSINKIIGYGNFVLTLSDNVVYVLDQTNIKQLVAAPSEDYLIDCASFSFDGKKIYAIISCNGNIYKVQTDLHFHEMKDYKDSKGTSKCDFCRNPFKKGTKGKKCKKCGYCCHGECMKNYATRLELLKPCLY